MLIAALTIALGVNVLVILEVLSQPYINLGLLVVAAGAWQYMRLSRRPRRQEGEGEEAGSGEARAGGRAATALWLALLLLWALSLVYIVLLRR